jgi:hypothetical protein
MANMARTAKQRLDCDGCRINLCSIGVRNGREFRLTDEIILQYIINLID